MEVKIVNGLHAHFNQPAGPSRAGFDWIVSIISESGDQKFLARTYDDDAPQDKPEQHAQRALRYVVQLINKGPIVFPPQQTGIPTITVPPVVQDRCFPK